MWRSELCETETGKLTAAKAFLLDAAMLLHRYGTPSHRLERVMCKVASSLGIESVFLYTPTALVISMKDADEETTVVRRVDSGEVHVDKLFRADEVLERLERKEISIEQAKDQLQQIDQSAPPYPFVVYAAACAASCAALAVLFHGSLVELVAALLIGLCVAGIERVQSGLGRQRSLLQPVAGFVAAVVSLAIARFIVPLDDRLVTLAGLIVLIPGLSLTVALTELAVGHLSAGVARLAGALVSLMTLFLGVAIAWRFAPNWRVLPEHPADTPVWWQWIALIVVPIAFAIVFQARMAQWPVIVAVAMLGILVSRSVLPYYGVEVASFAAALAVGCGSNLYARLRNRPALIALTPAMIVLVPGAFGYRSLSALLDHQTIEGVEFGFHTVLIAMCLVGGLLTSNAVVPPKRIL
ncbi:hypothetical protein Poly41_37430 [Novipirellula artificiosorum]|uniref:Inner membrane protein YjjP n=2 Tax=Novipirellula artificiosorum TaxID=2528016 RepID=A0A5C6DK68_9BACT|nr:hypothetical protein Poly41_37430 [Novipirellula artificiosorum]